MAAMESSASKSTDAALFVAVSLALGVACRHLLRGTRVPYTVALLILGVGLGSLGNSWGYLFLLYTFVQVSRIVVVGLLYPFLWYFGYGLDWKEAVIVIWSGLRGAVALSLSLSVKRSSDSLLDLSSEMGTLFVFFTGGVVVLMVIVNGSTTQFILHLLGMGKLSATKGRISDYTKYEMQTKALEVFCDLGDDEELGPADWPTVKGCIASLNNVGECLHQHSISGSHNNMDHMSLKDMRMYLLNAVQASYCEMFDERRIMETAANLLMQSVDEAMVLVSHEPLSDWKGLKSHVHFPSYYKFLQTSICPKKLATYLTVERLESPCYICAAFLRAHKIARKQLLDFIDIGETETASIVINESEAQEEEARRFLDDVRVAFPQVVRAVKTKQVAYSVLKQLTEFVQKVEKVGLVEEKEMRYLRDVVQTDLEKLLRNLPLTKISEEVDLINGHPFFGALPSAVRKSLKGSTKEIMEPSGSTLYQEGSMPSGIWLISNGLVKISRNKQLPNPVLTHGSTLGLYEALTVKPYLCDMITDSVNQCFFVETDEEMLSLLRSDPEIEEFLWQESVITLAKVLVPQIFESMPMWDLRELVYRSTMIMYIREETIEIPHHSIGFLLEGYIRSLGPRDEWITSPAALFPSHANEIFQSFIRSAGAKAVNFCSFYQADSRARIMIDDMTVVEVENGFQRRPSSFLIHSADQPSRSLARIYGGIMSCAEPFYKRRQPNRSSDSPDQQTKLSKKAMQLSIYGSMVDDGEPQVSQVMGPVPELRPLHMHPSFGIGEDDA